jgi:hypothetical protein
MTAPTLDESIFRMSCFGCSRFREGRYPADACAVGGLRPLGPVADERCRAGFQPKSRKEALQ